MTGSPVKVVLTRGVTLFLRHALELVSEARRKTPDCDPFRDSFEAHAARVSGVLKLLENVPDALSILEREGLVDTLRVARDLALAARHDPRWEGLGIAGDPAGEILGVRSALEAGGIIDTAQAQALGLAAA